jgi:hypothetical protein
MKPQTISTAKLFLIAISLLLFQYATAQNCPQCNLPNPDFVFNNNDIISNQTFQNFIIEINGTVYIDGSCEFIGCMIYLSEQARIELLPGPTELILQYNEFYNCCDDYKNEYMWDGIYTSDNDNHIFARNNYFLHGENVIVEAYGAEVILNSNEFDRCYYPLTLRDWSGNPRIEFRGNDIQCITPITALPSLPNQIPASGKTPIGIRIINYVSTGSNILTIGDASSSALMNYFEEIDIAISSENSAIKIINNHISYGGYGIFVSNTTGPSTICQIGGINQFDGNYMEDVAFAGIYITGFTDLEILNNHISGVTSYGMLLHNIVFNTKALITLNNIILGKNSIPFSGSISIQSFSGDLEITYNEIETHLFQGIPALVGPGIIIQYNQPGETERIEVRHNTITNTTAGISFYNLYSMYIDVISNDYVHLNTNYDFSWAGISVNDCIIERRIEIENNFIQNARYGIIVFNTDNCYMFNNTVIYTNLPDATNETIGIQIRWGQSCAIHNNNISMTNGKNTACWNYYHFRAILLYEVFDVSVVGNYTNHTYSGLFLVQGVMLSYIFCNVFDHSLYGVELYYGWHGVLAPNNEAWVGAPGMPANNEWHNHFCGTRRISGCPSGWGPGTKWYYKTGTEFEIDPAIHLDFWGGGNLAPICTTEVQNPCASLKSNPILPSDNLSQQQFTLLSTGQKDSVLKVMFGIIDSIIGYSPTATVFSMSSDVTQYEMVRNAYKVMVKNSWILNSGTTTANKYLTVKNFLSGTNIHKLITMDTLVSTKYLSQLSAEVGSFTPQNQLEMNAKSYFSAMANFLSNNHTLSPADSSILLTVATQSTFNGGYAVQKARNMLNLFIDDFPTYTGNPTPSLKQAPNEGSFVEEDEKLRKISVKVFPNPAQDIINFETEGGCSKDVLRLDIYGFTGELIISDYIGSRNNTAISTSELSNGIFFYRITKGNTILQKGKFVVNK